MSKEPPLTTCPRCLVPLRPVDSPPARPVVRCPTCSTRFTVVEIRSRCSMCGESCTVYSPGAALGDDLGKQGHCPSCKAPVWWDAVSCAGCFESLGVVFLHSDLGPRCDGYTIACPNCGKRQSSACVC